MHTFHAVKGMRPVDLFVCYFVHQQKVGLLQAPVERHEMLLM